MRFAAIVLAAAFVASCGGGGAAGEGERPVQLTLGTPNGAPSFGLSECSLSSIAAILVFDGSAGRQSGDYSTRSQWQSDAPDIVAVSDGTLRVEDGAPLPAGTLVARAPGVATISAKYLDFTASASVVVVPVQQLSITPQLTDLAANIPQQFTLNGVFADSPQAVDITKNALWDLNGEDARAFVDATTGLVHPGEASSGAPIQLFARLPACNRTVETDFQVSDLKSLDLEYEFPTPDALPVGASQKITLWGVFGDSSHTTQNLSTQATVRNDFAGWTTVLTGADSLVIEAVQPQKDTSIILSLYDGALQAQTEPMDVAADALTDISITPKQLSVTFPATAQLEALGTFATGLVIPITRHVAWASADDNVLKVDQTIDTAGLVRVADVTQAVQVTATDANATHTNTDTAQVSVFAQ